MSIETIITPTTIELVAKELVDTFAKEANEKTIEVDFKIKHGRMEINYPDNREVQDALKLIHGQIVPQANTHLSFNAPANTQLAKIKNQFCELIEQEEISDEDYSLIQKFVKNVINHINDSHDLIEKIKDTIRKLNKLDESAFLMSDSRLILFEFGHKEDYGDMIKVLNYSRYNKQLQSFVGEKRPVAKDLLLKRREFGYNSKLPTRKIYEKIIDAEKSVNNPLYADLQIEDVHIVREAKEFHMDIFIDYSIKPQEDVVVL